MEFIIVISLVIGLLVSIPLSIIFRGKGKVDKGFKVNYYQLSYRRKMIRTLLGLPILILAFFVFYFYIETSMSIDIFWGVFLFLLFSVQLIYNFYMWKKYEKQSQAKWATLTKAAIKMFAHINRVRTLPKRHER